MERPGWGAMREGGVHRADHRRMPKGLRRDKKKTKRKTTREKIGALSQMKIQNRRVKGKGPRKEVGIRGKWGQAGSLIKGGGGGGG